MPRRKQEQPQRCKSETSHCSDSGEEDKIEGEEKEDEEEEDSTKGHEEEMIKEERAMHSSPLPEEEERTSNPPHLNGDLPNGVKKIKEEIKDDFDDNLENAGPVENNSSKMETLKIVKGEERLSPKARILNAIKREKAEKRERSKSPTRSETPPLKRLMRQDPLPLFSPKKHAAPPKKIPREVHTNSKFNISPMSLSAMSMIKNAPTHPKQTMGKAKMYSNKIHRPFFPYPVATIAGTTHKSQTLNPLPVAVAREESHDEPLDLSKKTGPSGSSTEVRNTKSHIKASVNGSSGSVNTSSYVSSNGSLPSSLCNMPSTLQSLEQKFGSSSLLNPLRKSTSLASHLLDMMPSAHFALNSMKSQPYTSSSSSLHASRKYSSISTPLSSSSSSSSSAAVAAGLKSSLSPNSYHKRESSRLLESPVQGKRDKEEEAFRRASDRDLNSNITVKGEVEMDEDDESKYTQHRCSCQKTFSSLFSLSLHLQDTGHVPSGTKHSSLIEYPKLVRGQDMWLNQESEHTKRILRCIQCGESFKTLPLLTVHMMKTQHYTKIVNSDHGRRTHKCSTYCDRDTERECIFKCKVCNGTFSDMEGLANHMIISGHHKKNMVRSQNYLSELALHPGTLASSLQRSLQRKRYIETEEYPLPSSDIKKKCHSAESLSSVNGNLFSVLSPDISEDMEESKIRCENCGLRIVTHSFVDHVRECLKMKTLSQHNESPSDSVSNHSEKSPLPSPAPRVKTEVDVDDKPMIGKGSDSGCESRSDIDELEVDKKDDSEYDSQTNNNINIKQEEDSELEISASSPKSVLSEKCDNKDVKTEAKSPSSSEQPCEKDGSDREADDDQGPPSNSSKCDTVSDSAESGIVKTEQDDGDGKSNPDETSDEGEKEKETSNEKNRNLDILDPCKLEEPSSGNSALEAMQSFIQKSFSSKFSFRRGNTIFGNGEHLVIKPSSQGDGKISKHSPLDRFEKYRKYLQLDASPTHRNVSFSGQSFESKLCVPDSDPDSNGGKDDLQKLEKLCASVRKSSSPLEGEGARKKTLCTPFERPASNSSESGENLISKYLSFNEDEESEEKNKADSNSSALGSLSSFVYGQPLNSEHPLDSLQRLITKNDIPKLLSSPQSLKYFRPRAESPDFGLPLNLSTRRELTEEELEAMEREMMSDPEGSLSESESDNGSMEYKCAACSRHFASKGSYRYHLSRCHLSSVKKYGIKEAFNMSPYVYLPLDHTAKFSKYYEMANELAKKGK